MMRIGYDVTVLTMATGGVHRYTVNLLRALHTLIADGAVDAELTLVDYVPRRGPQAPRCDLTAFLGDRTRLAVVESPQFRRFDDSDLLRFRGGKRLSRQFDRLAARPQRWWNAAQTRRRTRRALAHLDVFHSSDTVQLRPRRGGVVATVFDLSPLHWPELHLEYNVELFRRKMAFVCQHADRIIAISQFTADDLAVHFPATADRIDVIYCAADETMRPVTDPAAVVAVCERYGIRSTHYVLAVGTLEPRKNLTRLVAAYAQVRACNGDATPPLVLAGARGWRDDEIFEAVAYLNLQDSVVFTGHVAEADLAALYSGADCVAYPSTFEGFGLPVLEAMACGAPVIAANATALPEVTGDAALLVAPQDVDGLANAIQRVLSDSKLRNRMKQQGLLRAACFSWTRAAQETLAVYEKAR